MIEAAAERLHAPLETRRRTVTDASFSLEETVLETNVFGRLYLPLKGLYQPDNAALVLQAVGILRRLGIAIPDKAVQGNRVFLEGVVSRKKQVVPALAVLWG